MRLDPAVAQVRSAIRGCLAEVAPAAGTPVLVACSGGADSLALLAGTVFEASHHPWTVIGATVDHGLQAGSAEHAERVVAQLAGLGVDETASVRVHVHAAGQGVEAAAREARYAALGELAERMHACVVLLGHTLDDQAETVLLGLARGSGGRSIAGMRGGFGPFRRPLLRIGRAQTEAACRAERIEFWTDPHNADPRFTRARVRHTVLPTLERELGPGVAATLARTADQLQEDLAALDDLAVRTLEDLTAGSPAGPGGVGLEVVALAATPPAVRRRVLRLAALAAGSPAGELFRVHVLAMDALVVDWHGQGPVDLPGRLHVVREAGELCFRPSPDVE